MPGSCDSDQGSSLISSLRRFRFQNKSKQQEDTASENSQSRIAPGEKSVDRPLLSQKSSSSYSPLSYRKYENPRDSFLLLQSISSKIQASLRSSSDLDLDLSLTPQEAKQLRELVLLRPSVSVKWADSVTEFKGGSSQALRVRRTFAFELSKYVTDVLNDRFARNSQSIGQIESKERSRPVRTYSKAQEEESSRGQQVAAMDDYEEFCEKEQCLRKMLDAFPGADIMEAQDILVKCDWNLKKAMAEVQSMPLRASRKRGLAPGSLTANQKSNATSAPKKFPEEIVLDSSDEEETNGRASRQSDSSGETAPPAKRARRLISTDSEDEVASTVALKSPASSSSLQKPSNASQKPNLAAQKPSSSMQPLPTGQKPGLSSGQPPILQKSGSTLVQQPIQQKPSTSVVRNVSNQNNSPAGKTVTIAPALSVKPLSSSANVSLKSVPSTTSSASVSVKPVSASSSGNLSVKPVMASSSGNVSVKPVPSLSSGSVSVTHVPIASSTNSVSVKPAANVSASPSPSASAERSSSMPNLPKGLSITQVGCGENGHKKPEKDTMSVNGSHSDKIPSNSKNSSQLVRIKGVSISPSTGSNKSSASDRAVTIPGIGKGMSITSVIPKNVSITPVQKSSNGDTSSSTEDESASEPKKDSRTDVKKTDLPPAKSSRDSGDPGKSSKGNHKVGRRTESGNLEEDPPKSSSSSSGGGRRKRLHLDYDDEDEDYGNEDIYDSEDSDCEENLTSAHSAVLRFFQESSADELGCIPGCSKKKVEAIVSLRPFTKWMDLVEKLRSGQGLSTDLLNGAKKVLDMRSAVAKLMNRCQRISLDMGDLVENLNEERESSSSYVATQPRLLNERMHLTAYQMLGLNWLLLMHNQGVNAILADEMGLGKTVQAIAFLAYLRQEEEEGEGLPHLIVVPSSTLDNWRKELESWWPGVSVICYHGQQDARRELRLQILNDEVEEFDIMITTYNMVTSSAEDRSFFKRLEFNYVVFDEAHMLKNMASQRYTNLMKIKAPRRLLLTGTPLQNNLVELMSLLIFTMPHMFHGKTEQIKQMFSGVSKATGNRNTYEKDRIEHAKRIMKPFVLRRLKRDVLKELPAKIDETKFCPMVEDQTKKYEELIQKFSAEVQDDEKGGSSSSGAGMMMQLRRAANHPLLLRRFYDDQTLLTMSKVMLKEPTHNQSDPNIIFEDMAVMSDFELHKLCSQYKTLKSHMLPDSAILNSGKFKVLDELLPDLIKEDHRILLFSQFTMVLDIVQEYMDIREYKFLRLDGQTPVSERQQLIDAFNGDPAIPVFLLSTRAGGLGINLTAADTVLIHDIDFNPYNDKQAEDRCHRVGQIRDVRVIRLISERSIEEGILQRARDKLRLERDIHEEDDEENDSASVAMLLKDALRFKAS